MKIGPAASELNGKLLIQIHGIFTLREDVKFSDGSK